MELKRENIAKCFHLEEIEVGCHSFRDKKASWVSHFWQATIFPSFHPPAILTTVHFLEDEFAENRHPDEILTCILLGEEPIGPIRVSADPVDPLFRNINLSPEEGIAALDGIEYKIILHSCQIRSSLMISTPTENSLLVIEGELFELAKTIQSQTKNRELEDYLEIWKEYLSGRIPFRD